MNKQSVLTAVGLPDEFSKVLIILAFVMLLAPYFAGLDFGVVKIPAFEPVVKRWLRVFGPILFLLVVGLHIPIIQTESPSPTLLKSPSANDPSGPVSVTIESHGARATAKVGESQINEYNRADILILARNIQTGTGITDLAPLGHTGGNRSVMPFPTGLSLSTKLVPPGGCVLQPIHIYNDGTGAYTLSVMTVAKRGPCPWKKGEYHYQFEVNTNKYHGQNLGKIVID